jgi:FkbM family methyltransferase
LLHPDTVTHEQAWRFFTSHKPIYDAMMRSLRGLVPPHLSVVDVGANIGYFSHRLRTELQVRGSFFLFEPHPNLARLCRETFACAPEVQVQELALGAEDGRATLYSAADGNIGWNTIVAERREPDMQPATVMVRRFDSLNLRDIGFVKIDVEGFEWAVIAGMKHFFSTGERPTLLIEIGWGTRHPHWDRAVRELSFLESIGYRYYTLDFEPTDFRRISRTTDVIAVTDICLGRSDRRLSARSH